MKFIKLLVIILIPFVSTAQETSHICAGQSVTLTATASGGTAPITYEWTSPSAVVTAGATVTAGEAGTWTWTAEDANGCTATGTHSIVIEATPSLVINAVNNCVGASQTISATGVPAGYTYSWNFGAGATPATSTSPTVSVAYSTSGSKNITLTISRTFTGSANGCSATCDFVATETITIGDLSGSSSCN